MVYARRAPEVIHEARRLLINQLKASVGATDHPAVEILLRWALETGGASNDAHVLWFGGRMAAEQACVINAALFEVLDFNETYIPTFQHAVRGCCRRCSPGGGQGEHSHELWPR